jgi:hypothetical protein
MGLLFKTIKKIGVGISATQIEGNWKAWPMKK